MELAAKLLTTAGILMLACGGAVRRHAAVALCGADLYWHVRLSGRRDEFPELEEDREGK